MDGMYSPNIIPTLYSKIGALTVRTDLLTAQNEELIAENTRLKELLESTDKDGSED